MPQCPHRSSFKTLRVGSCTRTVEHTVGAPSVQQSDAELCIRANWSNIVCVCVCARTILLQCEAWKAQRLILSTEFALKLCSLSTFILTWPFSMACILILTYDHMLVKLEDTYTYSKRSSTPNDGMFFFSFSLAKKFSHRSTPIWVISSESIHLCQFSSCFCSNRLHA